jgi:hypothetical protein
VVFANWVEPAGAARSAVASETRVAVADRQGLKGLAAVRPLISSFQSLIGREAMGVAVRRAEEAAAQ